MQKLLIPIFAIIFVAITTESSAQTPQQISLPAEPIKYTTPATGGNPESVCNFAGSFTLAQFIGNSNDRDLPELFLCAGDSFLLKHNGDAVLNGDPNPATTPGIAYALYECPPTITGDNLQAISLVPGPGDQCLWSTPFPFNGFYITEGVPNGGDSWFFNNGGINAAFNMNQPTTLYFAPITLDEITPPSGFESAPNGPVGPCVNVNTIETFKVIYLNPIVADGINTNSNNDCLGRFTIKGGYPEYNTTSTYDIEIFLTSNPNVKAVIQTQKSQLFHLAPVVFSVPQSGNYTIIVSDGKACPASFTINMSACDPSDNVILNIQDTVVNPGVTNLCVPITAENFEIVSASLSINWDPAVLSYIGIADLNPVLDPFTSSTLNEADVAIGQVGLIIYDLDFLGNTLLIPNDEALFTVCFDVIGALGDCSEISITNSPTAIGFEDEFGLPLALTQNSGNVCIGFQPLDYTVFVTDTTCLGTASVVVTATGGEGPYDVVVQQFDPTSGPTYFDVIDSLGGSVTFTGIGNSNNIAATYSVCINDRNNNTLCDTILLDIPTLGSQISFIQEPSCNGSDDGIIKAVVLVGGVAVQNPGPQFTFQWSPLTLPAPTGILQDGAAFGGVPSGNYTLIVRDTVRNCFAPVASGFLGQPLDITRKSVNVTNASCSGVSNGSITYEAQGGAPSAAGEYTYKWEDSNGVLVGVPTTANPITVNNLAEGTYRVTITDSNGCTRTDVVSVGAQKSITLEPSLTQLSVSCFGLSDGGAAVTVDEFPVAFGSVYGFTWSPTIPGASVSNLNKSSAYTNIPAGDYTVTATDANGCSATTVVTVSQPAELNIITLGQVNPICGQPNSGSISVVALGGNGGPNYNYQWSVPGNGQSQSGLSAGTYSVTVTDVKGCSDSMTFTLTAPTPPGINVSVTPVRCGGDGSLTANVANAASYTWIQLGTGFNIGNTQTITGLNGGAYAVTVTDIFGCIATSTAQLNNVVPLSFADTSIVQPTCFGGSNGVLGVVVQNGQAPYVNYSWSPAQTNSPTIFSLKAGTYAVTVTDNAGCTLTGSFTLNQPPQVLNTVTGVQGVSCFGVCDGTASSSATYGTIPPSSGSFTYIWNDGFIGASRNNLCAGVYTVTAADPNNCSNTDTITIGSPTAVTSASTNTIDASCFGLSNGTATVAGTGGNGGPYSVLWSNGTAGNTATSLAAGTYRATITDASGCTGVVSNIIISQPPQISLSQDLIQTEAPKCFGDSDGMIAVNVTGGNTGQVNYKWFNASGTAVGNERILEDIPAGDYTVVITDSEGCSSSATYTLQNPPPVTGKFNLPSVLSCFGDETTLRVDTIYGGNGGPYQFSVDFGAVLSPGFPVTVGGGDHYVTYYDITGCYLTDTVTVVEPAKIEVVFDPDVFEIELGDTTYRLKPLISGAAIDTFFWNPEELVSNPGILNPKVNITKDQRFTLQVVDDNGCTGEGSILIEVDPNRNIYVPNVFKPGFGGENDHFNVYAGRGVKVVNYMRVFDRWGNLMFDRESFYPDNNNLADGWDGKFNGQYVNPAVFVYIIEVEFLDGKVLLYRGDVTVVR